MLLIRAILLWSIISLHVVGGAALFRRFFPRESPWFGFIVPSLALVILMNFVEHIVAVPSLLWLLPFSTLVSGWAIVHPKLNWKGLRLPTGIFLVSFAFTLTVRSLKPDILAMRDGIVDLGFMSSFCMGEKVPPAMSWYPNLPFCHYYSLGHYGMSVLTRLLNLDTGTGFNLSSALRSAFDCFITAAAAWRISRQKIWITVLAPILMEGAATGATAYLWFTTTNLDPNEANSLLAALKDPQNHSPILKLVHDACPNELMPPGGWMWIGSFHSTCGGQFLVLFFVWSMAEVLRGKKTNWPWICLGTVPLLTIVTSTWALPLEVLLLVSAFFWIWYYQLYPRNFRFVLLVLAVVTVLLAPVLSEFLTSSTFVGSGWTDPNCRTQLIEYVALWWPLYLPALFLVFVWRKLPPVVKTIIISLPIALVFMEYYTVGCRLDWTGKLWCYIYGAGWITLIPAVFMRRAVMFRLLTLLLIISSLCSFGAWSSYLWRISDYESGDLLHLEGVGPFRWDGVRGKLLVILSRMKGQIILTGKSSDGSTPFLAAFSGNRAYLVWPEFIDGVVSGAAQPIAMLSNQEVDDFYNGKCDNPLLFLRTHDIAAVVVYPDEKISPTVVESLKMKLTPYYEYVDCHQGDSTAGVFIFHPGMVNWPDHFIMSPSQQNPVPATPDHP